MKLCRCWGGLFAFGAFLLAAGTQGADGVWKSPQPGNWSDATKWSGGVPGDGGAAAFSAAAGTFAITNDRGTVTLSRLFANTNADDAAMVAEWRIIGGTNEMVAPAVIYTKGHSFSVREGTLSGNTDITITGLGRFFLGDNNLYTGRTIVSNGNVRVARDSGLGPVPVAFSANAITLDGGGMANDDNGYTLVIHTNRGITVTANGGFLSAGYMNAGLQVNGPVTGAGLLGINYENSPVILNNPLNDYSGGTVVGTNGPAANKDCAPTLKLGQNEVIPHGSGKGGLKINTDGGFYNTLPNATLDLNGMTETVNALASGPRAVITSSLANQGRLIVGGLGDDSEYRGSLNGGATIEKRGSGTLTVIGARLSNGTLDLREGTLRTGGANLEAGSTVLFSGGDLLLSQPAGLYEFYGTGGAAFDRYAALSYGGWRLWPEKASETVAATFVNGRQYSYRGRWCLPQSGVYSFAKGFNDAGSLTIDGVNLLYSTLMDERAVTNNVPLAAGWHTVDLRVSDASGAVGPMFGFRSGILYDEGNGGFTNAAELARARMFADDAGANLVADGYDNVMSGRLMLAQDGTLTVPPDAGKLVFAGVVTTNAPAGTEPVLTVSNGGLPLFFGSSGAWPAVLDAAVSSEGGIVLTNRVWLRRIPAGSYRIASGADVALDGAALLGDAALNLTNFSVRVVRNDSIGGSVTANVNTAVWFDTMRYADNRLTNSAAAQAYDNDVTLNGGAARFTGFGSIAYGGALTGTGNVVKDSASDLLLTGTGSSFSGEIQINAGRLLPASESALGGAAVRINGGRLANPAGEDLTLGTTPVIAQSGGIEVTAAGETMTVNGQVTGVGNISKWGSGRLVLGGTAINTNLSMHVREGTLELAKSGAAVNYAVKNLIGVEPGTAVRLTGSNGNQIGGGVTLSGGTLDLNGISEAIGVLTNTAAGGVVTNGGAQPATLTVGQDGVNSLFSGQLADGSAALAVAKTGAGTMTLSPRAIAYTGGTQVEGGTLRISHLTPPTSNLACWLDAADANKLSFSNSYVTAWADSFTGAVNFSQATVSNRPLYVVNAINGRPALRFGSGARTRMVASKGVVAKTVFIVCRMTSYSGLDGLWGQNQNDSGIRAKSLTSWQHTSNGANNNDFTFLGQMYINGVAGTSFGSQQPHVLTAVSSNAVSWTAALGDYWFNSSFPRYFKGEIGEVLVYSTALGADDRQAVEAYLKEKWFGGAGLSLDQTVTLAKGAQLMAENLNLEIGALSGGGVLVPEGRSVVTLPDYAGFTGTVSGAGTVALKSVSGTAARFLPQGLGTTVRNDGTSDTVLNVMSAGTNTFSGIVQDGSNQLGITQGGGGLTYYSGTNSTYTGETRIEAGTAVVQGGCVAQYVRFSPVLMRIGGSNYVTNEYQLSEFQLMSGGERLAYPAGTTASGRLGNINLKEPPENTIDGSADTKFYTSLSDSAGPNSLVVALPYPVMFDGYRWYTANDSTGRDPVEWRVEVSMDGGSWSVVDYRDFGDNMAQITTSRNTLVGTWSIAAAMSEMNVFSDLSATAVAAAGVLEVSVVSETVGALSGSGSVRLSGGGTLGINAFTNAAFSGGFSGRGKVVKTGTATQALSGALAFTGTIVVEAGTLDLDGAALSGVTNIVIRNGATLTGAATVNNDLIVTFETGGTYGASLAVAGALTVNGQVKLAVPGGAAYPYYRTLFTYASADETTRSALATAVKPSSVPAGYAALVRVTATAAQLAIAPVGSVMTLQ